MQPNNLFRERLAEGLLVADGAMGTMLYARGIPFNRCFDDLNLTAPELVRAIHREYVDAGAEIVETNTFGASRLKLGAHGLAAKTADINVAGVRLAREAAGERGIVAGSIGPIARVLAPIGKILPADAEEIFREQAAALAEGGADVLFLETMPDLAQMGAAIRGARAACDLPLVCLVTFTEEGRSLGGEEPRDVALGLAALGVDVIGANCSVGPQPMLEVIRAMTAESVPPVAALPNAGFPRLVDGRYLYLTSPEYLAETARSFFESGVTLFGGCCGTTPQHIRAVSQVARMMRPARRGAMRAPATVLDREPAPPAARLGRVPAEEKSELGRKLGRSFVVSVEMNPPRGVDPSRLIDAARMLKEGGVDVINVADGSRASARMSSLVLARLIQKRAGMETILHYTCRDRNLLGLQADLLGAHALEVRNILAVTGDPPRLGDYPDATGVFDVDSIGLVRIISALNSGLDLAGKEIGEPTAILIGVGANPGAADLPRELDRLAQKIESGAEYILTQPVYEHDLVDAFMARVGAWKIPVLMGILPLRSHRHAEFLHNEVPGMSIPAGIRARMQRADDMVKEGLAIAREAMELARSTAAGAYIMPPFGRYESALDILEPR